MIYAHRVSLDGRQLDEVDDRIVVQGVEDGAGRDNLTSASHGGDGSRITGKRRESLDVTVKFSILLRKPMMAERMEVLEKIGAWAAGGGILRVGHRDRRIRVQLVSVPAAGDPWAYDTVYSIVFRASGVPYWQQDTAETATTGSGTSGSAVIRVDGSARTVCDATVNNVSGATVNTVNVNAGGSVMKFSGLAMGASEALVIDHDGEGVLRIRIRSASGTYRSAMAMRSIDSADDLFVQPGERTVSFSGAQRACRMTVSCRGRYL